MKAFFNKFETLSALFLSLFIMAVLFGAARKIRIWDMLTLRSNAERIFTVDLSTPWAPSPHPSEQEIPFYSHSDSRNTQSLFAKRPLNPQNALPEIKLDALQPPSISNREIKFTPVTPNLSDLLNHNQDLTESPEPEALIAIRRPAGKEQSAAVKAGMTPINSDSYQPRRQGIAPGSSLPTPPITENAPQPLLPRNPFPEPEMVLPIAPAATLEANRLLNPRLADEHLSLEKDLIAELEYSPRAANGSRHFRLSFQLRPGSSLAPLAKDVIFLIDVSQSIESQQIRAMRDAIGEYVRNLRAGDRWNIFKFSEKIYPLRPDFLPAGTALPEDFTRFFSRPANEYMTDLFVVMQTILQKIPSAPRPCNVFLLTDGFATYGHKEVSQLLRGFKRINRDRFSIMPFMLGDKGMADLLRLLAYQSRGFFRKQLGDKKNVAQEMLRFFEDYDRPLLFACVANYTNLPSAQVYPAVLPNLYFGQQVTFYGQTEMTPEVLIRVKGWDGAQRPREFYFRPEAGKIYPTGDWRIRREWATWAAMEHVHAIIAAESPDIRKEKSWAFRRFINEFSLEEFANMAKLLEKNY